MKTPLESAEYMVQVFGLSKAIKSINLLIMNTPPLSRIPNDLSPVPNSMEYWQEVKAKVQEGMGELSVFLQNIETTHPKARKIVERALAEQHKNTRHQVIDYLHNLDGGNGPEAEEMVRDIMNLYQKSPLEGHTQFHDKLKYD